MDLSLRQMYHVMAVLLFNGTSVAALSFIQRLTMHIAGKFDFLRVKAWFGISKILRCFGTEQARRWLGR